MMEPPWTAVAGRVAILDVGVVVGGVVVGGAAADGSRVVVTPVEVCPTADGAVIAWAAELVAL